MVDLTGQDVLAIWDKLTEVISRAVFRGMRMSHGRDDNGRSYATFEWNGREWRVGLPKKGYDWGMGKSKLGNDGYGLWFWMNRKDQPWQADLEAHVQRELESEQCRRLVEIAFTTFSFAVK